MVDLPTATRAGPLRDCSRPTFTGREWAHLVGVRHDDESASDVKARHALLLPFRGSQRCSAPETKAALITAR